MLKNKQNDQVKTIAIVLGVNNPGMLTQGDLDKYHTEVCYYKIKYAKTHLKELNTVEDVKLVTQPVIDAVIAAEKEGANAVIIFCFGDLAVKEAGRAVNIPVMGAGKYAVHVAAEICEKAYTIIPGKLLHNDFIEPMVYEMGLSEKFKLADHSADLFPSEIRLDKKLAISRLYEAACKEIEEKSVDTLTMGCTCFIGMAKPLKAKLDKKYKEKRKITVIDPVEIAFAVAREIV